MQNITALSYSVYSFSTFFAVAELNFCSCRDIHHVKLAKFTMHYWCAKTGLMFATVKTIWRLEQLDPRYVLFYVLYRVAKDIPLEQYSLQQKKIQCSLFNLSILDIFLRKNIPLDSLECGHHSVDLSLVLMECTERFSVVLHCTANALCYAVLYCTVLCCAVLCNMLCFALLCCHEARFTWV